MIGSVRCPRRIMCWRAGKIFLYARSPVAPKKTRASDRVGLMGDAKHPALGPFTVFGGGCPPSLLRPAFFEAHGVAPTRPRCGPVGADLGGRRSRPWTKTAYVPPRNEQSVECSGARLEPRRDADESRLPRARRLDLVDRVPGSPHRLGGAPGQRLPAIRRASNPRAEEFASAGA